MERDTKKVETPVGKIEVVLKEWLTGREKRSITNVYLSDIKLSQESEAEEVSTDYKITGDMLTKSQDAAIEAVVFSVDGKQGEVLNAVLDLRDEDYQFVISEINKITNDTSEEDKKK